jgi:hypothetical protein
MNFQKIAVLTGLSVAGVLASGAFSSAHAISLNYTLSGGSGIFSDGGSLSGSFTYDSDLTGNAAYSNVNLSVSGGTQFGSSNLTYSTLTPTGSSSTVLRVTRTGLPNPPYPNPTRVLQLAFANSLPTTLNGTTTLLLPSDDSYSDFSFERASGGGTTANRGVTGVITITATSVPFETDALPIVGATIAFGAGAVAKRKIAQAKSKKINFEPVKSEELSKVG